MSNPLVVFYRPSFDTPTKYTSYYLGLLVSHARRRGWRVIETDEPAKAIAEHKPELFIAGCHGTPWALIGPEDVRVIWQCVNDQVLSERIAYFIACDAAQELGYRTVRKGAVGMVGFLDDVIWAVKPPYDPATDELAKPEWEAITAVGRLLLDGRTLREACNEGIRKCDEWIRRLWTRVEPDWAQVIGCLEHNRDALIAIGERVYILAPPVEIPWHVVLAILGIVIAKKT